MNLEVNDFDDTVLLFNAIQNQGNPLMPASFWITSCPLCYKFQFQE